ncbi:MAG TPA: nicotianamine synthase family protein [Candidatus Saccharimonadales bacterium]
MPETLPPSYREVPQLIDTDLTSSESVNAATQRLEAILLGTPANPAEDVVSIFGQDAIDRANALYETYETNLELSFADRLLRGDAETEDYPLFERFKRLIEKEVELRGIGPSDKVLFIGSGPFPISPILIHQLSGGASVDCFDFSDEAIEVSTMVLEKIGLADSIKVTNIAAHEARLPSISTPGEMGLYGTVFVALLTQPKSAILSHVWRSITPGEKIVMRKSEGNRQILYKGISDTALDWLTGDNATPRPLKVVGEYHAGVDDTISGNILETDFLPNILRL